MGRRTETTDYLKECIADALFQLMETQEIEKIRIDDITKLAGVGRMTYFRYFNSKIEVLHYKMEQLFYRWADEHPELDETPGIDNALEFFRFCVSVKPYIELLHRHGQMGMMTELMMTPEGYVMLDRKDRFKLIISSYMLHGIVRAWAENDFRETPEELVQVISEMKNL